jgi:hypothetical protein
MVGEVRGAVSTRNHGRRCNGKWGSERNQRMDTWLVRWVGVFLDSDLETKIPQITKAR